MRCGCGDVELKFRDGRVIERLLCGCCDCRQHLEWAASRGGPPLPSEFAPLLDLVYVSKCLLRHICILGEVDVWCCAVA